MSKSKNLSHAPVSNQGNLFDGPITEGTLNVSLSFRDALTKAFSRCTESRFVIAARISELSGKEISKDILDKCTSSNLDYGLRAEHLPAACYVAQTIEPAQALLNPLGATVISPEESDYLRLAKLIQEDNKRQIEMARIRARLGIKGM